MIKAGIGFAVSKDAPFRFDWGGSFVVGVSQFSNLRVSPVGATKVGIETITAERGFSLGFEAEATLPLGRTGLLLGVISSLMGLTGGAELKIETTEDSDFQSNVTHISPLTVGVFLEYWFPS
jgi:hypothetical protein